MSAWIKLHANAFAHPKTLRMAKRLGVSPAAVVGHLASLWTWALEYAPQGDLASFEVEELEIAAGWEGDDGAFVNAAVVAGYLDATEAGLLHDRALTIHDWNDYAGNLLARRERNRDYMRKARGHHVGTTARPRGGLEKSREELNHSSPADADEGVSAVYNSDNGDRFAEFWMLYPRKVGKAEAQKRWAKMNVKSRVTAIAAAGHLATYARSQGAELRFIPHPATFIGPKRTYEDWANGMPAGYGAQSAAPKRDACPDCGTDLTFDEELRPHCPYCGWRPT